MGARRLGVGVGTSVHDVLMEVGESVAAAVEEDPTMGSGGGVSLTVYGVIVSGLAVGTGADGAHAPVDRLARPMANARVTRIKEIMINTSLASGSKRSGTSTLSQNHSLSDRSSISSPRPVGPQPAPSVASNRETTHQRRFTQQACDYS